MLQSKKGASFLKQRYASNNALNQNLTRAQSLYNLIVRYQNDHKICLLTIFITQQSID